MARARADSYGNGRLYRRGATWWLDYSVRGERIRESSGTRNRTEALRLLREKIGDVAAHRAPGQSVRRVTVADLLERVAHHYRVNGRRSTKRLAGARKHLERCLDGTRRAVDVTPDLLDAYAAKRLGEGAARATLRYELAVLRKGFKLATTARVLPTAPTFPTVAVHNARKVFLTPEELGALLAHLPPDVADVVQFAYLTGWRAASEVLPLRWDRVDFAAGVVVLLDSKNASGRTFPLDVLPALRALLERRRAYTETLEAMEGRALPFVFHRRGKPIRDFRDAWATACRAAGLVDATGAPTRHPHDCRRSAVRNLVRAGVELHTAMALTGHKTAEVFRRYDIVDERDLREGVRRLAAYLAPERTEAGR